MNRPAPLVAAPEAPAPTARPGAWRTFRAVLASFLIVGLVLAASLLQGARPTPLGIFALFFIPLAALLLVTYWFLHQKKG